MQFPQSRQPQFPVNPSMFNIPIAPNQQINPGFVVMPSAPSLPPPPPQVPQSIPGQQSSDDIVNEEDQKEDDKIQSSPIDEPKEQKEKEEDNSIPLVYPVEIFIFALLGWAWLSFREMLGSTPVLDAGVVISLLVTGTLNLLLSILLPDKESFKPWAKSFSGQAISIWILYLHSIIESVGGEGSMTVCCGGGIKKDGISFSKVQAEVFFGGLLMHQIFAIITFCFLTVQMFVSLLQVRANHVLSKGSTLRNWIPKETWTATFVLLILHTILFSVSSLNCNRYFELVMVIIILAVLIWLMMVSPAKIIIAVSKRKHRPYTPSFSKRIEIVFFVVDFSLGFLALILAFVLLAVLGGRISISFIVIAVLYLVWFLVILIRDIRVMKAMKHAERITAEKKEENSLKSILQFTNPRGVLLQQSEAHHHGRTKKLR
jgi:hypothetical protein